MSLLSHHHYHCPSLFSSSERVPHWAPVSLSCETACFLTSTETKKEELNEWRSERIKEGRKENNWRQEGGRKEGRKLGDGKKDGKDGKEGVYYLPVWDSVCWKPLLRWTPALVQRLTRLPQFLKHKRHGNCHNHKITWPLGCVYRHRYTDTRDDHTK